MEKNCIIIYKNKNFEYLANINYNNELNML